MNKLKNFLANAVASLAEKYAAAPVEKNHYTYPDLAKLELEKKPDSGAVKPKFVLPKGVQAYSLEQAAEIFPKQVQAALDTILSRNVPAEHKFYKRAKLESITCGGAFFIDIPAKTEVELKISLPKNSKNNFPSLFTVLSVGENSQVKVIEETSISQGLCSTEVLCAANSSTEFVSVSKATVQTKENALISQKRFFVGENASAESYSAFLGGGLVKAETEMVLQAQGATSRDCQAAFASASQHFDLSSTARHEAPSTKAHSIVKSVLSDKGRVVLWGKLFIAKGAKLSDSFLKQTAVMLNAGARADAMPILEIEENDVRATHASSVSHVDDNALFYLNSRGIPTLEAKKTIASSLLESAFEKSTLQQGKDELDKMVELKWRA